MDNFENFHRDASIASHPIFSGVTVLTFVLSALAFVLLLTVLILIHEAGHFTAARLCKVEVEEFGFGLPPRAKTLFTKWGTQFTLNWIPFGGFVRLKGENALRESERRAKGSFSAASTPARIVILCAGVLMNFLLAVALLTFGFSYGRWMPTYFSVEEMRAASAAGVVDVDVTVLIEDVVSGGGAAQVGVPERSILAAVDGVPVDDPDDVTRIQEGKTRVIYTVQTGEEFSEERTFTVRLDRAYRSGIVITHFPRVIEVPRRGLLTGFALAMREARVMTVQTVLGVGHLVRELARTGRVPEGIAGLVGIAQLTYSSVQAGFATYLRLVALLSLSLAILNILPFPALDGGRLLFVLAELISRRPVNRRFEVAVNAAGFVFLIAMILVITFYDIVRLF